MKKTILFLLIALFYAVCLPARSLYVNGFASILGNSANENALLDYAQSHEITTLLLYELHIVNAATPLNNTAYFQ